MILGADIYQIIIEHKSADAELRKLRTAVDAFRSQMVGADKSIDAVEKSLRTLAGEANQANGSLKRIRTGVLEFDAAVNLASRGLNVLRKGLGALSGSINIANAFETELTAIDTITDQVGTKFRDQFLAISERTGQEAAEVARAAYEAVSAGVAQESAAQFVEVSNELARSGRAGLTESLELLATIREQFGLADNALNRVNSQIFLATRDGRTKVSELAADLGGLIPLAKSAGQSLEEMLGGIVSITKAGITTNIATTQLRAYAVAVQKNGGNIAKALTAAGEAITETEFKSLSLSSQVQLLTKVYGGNEGALIKLFGRIEGVQAVQLLARDGAVELEKAVAASTAATNEAAIAAGQFAETGAAAQQRLKATFQRQLIELGTQVMPAVNKVMGELVQLLRDNGAKTAQFIEGIARSAVNLGRFVAQYGEPILFFFGALFAQKLATQAAGLVAGLNGARLAVAGIGTASKAAAPGVLALTGAVGGLVAVLPLLIAGAQQVGDSLGQILTQTDRVEQRYLEIANRINAINLEVSLGEFESNEALDARRAQIRAGDQVVLNPEFSDNGAITRAAAEGVESMADLLERGFDQANDIVQANLAQLSEVATQQANERDVRLDELNAKSAEVAALNARLSDIEQGTAEFSITAYSEAFERRRELNAELVIIEGEAADAQRRAADAELTRANLSLKFQAEVTRKLRGLIGGFSGQFPTLAELVAGAPAPTSPNAGQQTESESGSSDIVTPRGRRRRPDVDPFAGEGVALVKALEAQLVKADGINQRAADNRVAAIEDTNERELAALDLRFERELLAASRNGDDLAALKARQTREAFDLFDRIQAEEKARAQSRADFEVGLIEDKAERELAALRLSQEQQIQIARDLGVSLVEVRAAQERELTELTERQNQARVDSYFTTAESIGQAGSALFNILETLGGKSQLLTGIQVIAEGVFLQAKAIRYAVQAGERFLSADVVRGAGFTALALQAQAGAVQQFKLATELGASKGGGSASASPRRGGGGSGSANGDRRPTVNEGRNQQPMVINIGGPQFNGDVYDTREGAERAFGVRSLRGLAAVQFEQRGLPRVDMARFNGGT